MESNGDPTRGTGSGADRDQTQGPGPRATPLGPPTAH